MDVPIYILIYLYCCFSNSVKTTVRFSMSWPWTWKTKNLQLVCTKDTKKCCQNQKMLAKVSQMLPSKVIGGSWGSSWSFPRPNAIRILSAPWWYTWWRWLLLLPNNNWTFKIIFSHCCCIKNSVKMIGIISVTIKIVGVQCYLVFLSNFKNL